MAFQLILISGLPGCGKTSLAKSIVTNSRLNIKHFEADDYFTSNGVYKHNQEEIQLAHDACIANTRQALLDTTVDKVIVANTFIRMHERQPYVDMFLEIDHVTEISFQYPCNGTGSTKDIPQEKLEIMRSRLQYPPLSFMRALREEKARRLQELKKTLL